MLRFLVDHPVPLAALVLGLAVIGLATLARMPIQLTPDLSRPVVTVSSAWLGAGPMEMEREILIPQEQALAGLPDLERMVATARQDGGSITLEFGIGVDGREKLRDVANRLSQAPPLPAGAAPPRLFTSNSNDLPIAWFHLRADETADPPGDPTAHDLGPVVRDAFRRLPGVSRVLFDGAPQRRLEVHLEAGALARYRVSVPEVLGALRASSEARSIMRLDEGKRRYSVRLALEIEDADGLAATPIRVSADPASGEIRTLRLGDVAETVLTVEPATRFTRIMGQPGVTIGLIAERGSNVVAVMRDIKTLAAELNAGPLAARGLVLQQAYDDTDYVTAAIGAVAGSLALGAILAALVLLLSLRRRTPLMAVLMTMPLSVLIALPAIAFFGGTLNVLSLAGLVIAIGLVVDGAIVVTESIERRRGSGEEASTAAISGTRAVAPAVIASTATTLIVFAPLLMLETETGQLFRDVSLAITLALAASLLVALSAVPVLMARSGTALSPARAAPSPLARLDRSAEQLADRLMALVGWIITTPRRAALVAAGILLTTLALTVALFPSLDYLPQASRNQLFAFLQAPAGYNPQTTEDAVAAVERQMTPLWAAEGGAAPKIDTFLVSGDAASAFFAVTAPEGRSPGDLAPGLREAISGLPGFSGFVGQPSLFVADGGSGRAVSLELSGGDIDTLVATARTVLDLIEDRLGPRGLQTVASPPLDLGAPELRLSPDRQRLALAGFTPVAFGETLAALTGGLTLGDLVIDGDLVPLVVRGPPTEIVTADDLEGLAILTPAGQLTPLIALIDVSIRPVPLELRRIDGRRTISLDVNPPPGLSVGALTALLERDILPDARQAAAPHGIALRLGGAHSRQAEALADIGVLLLLAPVLVYLVMAASLGGFLRPLIVLITLPTALAGGMLTLTLARLVTGQTLDLLTALGFVLLIGSMVNNVILIVHGARLAANGTDVDPILAATRARLRPIALSTLTTFFGLLPLVISQGAGAELYRGLATVFCGGLAVSAFLVIVLTPALLRASDGFTGRA